MIVVTDINNILQKFNILNLKKSKDNIDKLMNLIKIDQKTNKYFSFKIVFTFSILSAISISIIFKEIIKSCIKLLKIMHLNNIRALIVNKIQEIVNITLY